MRRSSCASTRGWPTSCARLLTKCTGGTRGWRPLRAAADFVGGRERFPSRARIWAEQGRVRRDLYAASPPRPLAEVDPTRARARLLTEAWALVRDRASLGSTPLGRCPLP